MVKRRAACLSFLPQTLQIVLWREWEKSSTDLSGKEPRQKSLQHQKLHVLAERKWIDAGGNPVVRHEGVPPSNNLIKDGTHRAIRTCPSDIYKIVNVFMDYARLLELVNDEWDLDPYRCAVNEVTADKLRSIAKKYQEAIDYDYEAAMTKWETKRKKQHTDDDVGGDALELAMKRGKRSPKKKEK